VAKAEFVMIESIFGFIFYLMWSLIFWLVLFPVIAVLATPIIFFIVLFKRDGNFVDNMKNEYQRLWMFWKDWGILLVP
jgi:hypothetical protein